MSENSDLTIESEEPRGLTRRQVAKGAAWAVPVLAVASASPAFASSPPPDPDPAPSGGLSIWQGGTSIGTWTVSSPQRVEINQAQNVGFIVLNPDSGEPEPEGKYTSGAVLVTVTWGAGGTVTTPGSYTLTPMNLNGWELVGPGPAPGTSGSVQYQRVGIVNGPSNVVPLPHVRLVPTGGGPLVPSFVQTTIQSQYLSPKGSNAVVP